MKSANSISDNPKYIENDGKQYEIIEDGIRYAEHIKQNGARAVIATKSGYVIARRAKKGELLNTYVESGILESTRVAGEDNYFITKAKDKYGTPVIDSHGRTNTYMIDGDELRKRYSDASSFTGVKVLRSVYIEHKMIQVDRNVAFMKPWGEGGSLVPQFLEAGGYMNISNPDDIYGISEVDFNDTYIVIREM